MIMAIINRLQVDLIMKKRKLILGQKEQNLSRNGIILLRKARLVITMSQTKVMLTINNIEHKGAIICHKAVECNALLLLLVLQLKKVFQLNSFKSQKILWIGCKTQTEKIINLMRNISQISNLICLWNNQILSIKMVKITEHNNKKNSYTSLMKEIKISSLLSMISQTKTAQKLMQSMIVRVKVIISNSNKEMLVERQLMRLITIMTVQPLIMIQHLYTQKLHSMVQEAQ